MGKRQPLDSLEDPRQQPNGGFYVFEHGDISRATLRFLERDGHNFRFQRDGLCDVHWDENYGEDVPFKIEGWATFTEIRVRGSGSDTDESLAARLAKHLDVRDFVQQPMQLEARPYDDGVKVAYAIFKPKGKIRGKR